MKALLQTLFVSALAGAVLGCGSDDSNKPTTKDEVTQFKGDPKSPALQKSLQGHFGGGTAPAAPSAPSGG